MLFPIVSRFTGSFPKHYDCNVVVPRIDQLIKISDVFNVSIDYLAGMTDERTPSISHLSAITGLSEETIKNIQKQSMATVTKPFSVSNIADIINVFVNYVFENERSWAYFERTVRNIRILADIVKNSNELENVTTPFDDAMFEEYKKEVTKRKLVVVAPEPALRYYVDDLASVLKNAVTKEVVDYMEGQAQYFKARAFKSI